MANINMSFVDGIHNGRCLTMMAKEMRSGLNEYMDTMTLPEGTDSCQRANIKLWVNKYIDGDCSFKSLNNLLTHVGFGQLLESSIHEVEVDKSGKITIYNSTK